MALMEMKWGLVPDMAGMALLPDLMRPDILAELVFRAREFDGTEAVQLGIATRTADDPIAAALALAAEIAARSPDAERAAKRLLRMDGDRAAKLRAEAREQIGLIGRPNQREAMAAGMPRRAPIFEDPTTAE